MVADSALLTAQLASVRAELLEVIVRLSDDLLDWAPSDGMRTVHGQLLEILGTEQHVLEMLRGNSASFQESEAKFSHLRDLESLMMALDGQRSELIHWLDAASPEQLRVPAVVSPGFAEYLQLEEVPASELVRFLARHESYHAGQLVSYLWGKGDNPYHWGAQA